MFPLFPLYFCVIIRSFKYRTITSGEFKDFFMAHFTSPSGAGFPHISTSVVQSLQAIDWPALYLSRGMPVTPVPDFSNSLSREVETEARLWLVSKVSGTAPPLSLPLSSSSSSSRENVKVFGTIHIESVCLLCNLDLFIKSNH